jgi:hypothetical protein
MKTNLSDLTVTDQRLPKSPEGATVAKIVGAGVTGALSFVAAMLTTFVEAGGFWRYFWLGACILFFICAFSLVILAGAEGLRIDHAGIRFQPRKIFSAEQEARKGEDQRVV